MGRREILSLFALSLAACKPATRTSDVKEGAPVPEASSFNAYVAAYATPELQQDNARSIQSRLDLIDQAPAGATVKLMTFLWDEGPTAHRLAAHLCAAALRGVKVQVMPDAKSGSIPDDDKHFFNNPIQEETYRYLANCGARVMVYNHLGPTFFTVMGGAIVPSEKLIGMLKKDPVASPINRLNHRKLLVVENGQGSARTGCLIMGGRNVGDHYYAHKKGTYDFHDADVLICRHHAGADAEQLFSTAHRTFDELWSQSEITYPVVPDVKFRFKHIWFRDRDDSSFDAAVTRNALDPKNPVALLGENFIDSIAADDPKAKSLNIDVEKARRSAIPVPVLKVRFNKPGFESAITGGYAWRILTSGWRGEVDQIRDDMLVAMDSEREEIFLESGYIVFDDVMASHITGALKRGVKVTVVTNSFPVLHAGGKPIRLLNDTFIAKSIKEFGAKGLFTVKMASADAERVIHAKTWHFRCQVTQSQGKNVAYAYSSVGSHNFHPRSGVADKEMAITWRSAPTESCLKKAAGAVAERPATGNERQGVALPEQRLAYYDAIGKDEGATALVAWKPNGGFTDEGMLNAAYRTMFSYVTWALEPARDIIAPYM